MRELGAGLRVGVLLWAAVAGICSVGWGQSAGLAGQIEGLLADPVVARAHWGIMVTAMDGSPIYAMNAGQLFQPASNAKLFTTAAALAIMGGGATFETKVMATGIFSGTERLQGNLILVGGGDANLSGRAVPYVAPALRPKAAPGAPALAEPDPLRYLAQMADGIAATGLKVVNGDVVGDDRLFRWEPYAEDWSIDDTVWGYGAPVSALSINDNQLKVTVTPGAAVGTPATVMIDPAAAYYTLDVSGLRTGVAKTGSHVQMERALGSKVLRLYGTIAVDAPPNVEEVAIHDPAEYAAMALKELLEARGIVVSGVARARHLIPDETKGFLEQVKEGVPAGSLGGGIGCAVAADGGSASQVEERVIASHRSAPLAEDVVVTNKVSQNLHAEMLLRDLARRSPTSLCDRGWTIAEGAQVIRAFLTTMVGIDKDDFVFFDGSGLSGHDLVAPRATVRLLRYASTQPWFADWKRSLPVGGEDGSLIERFGKVPLKDHVFAKTGTLGEARALSGYLDCASGKTVIFSIMVGNHMPRSNADREAMDKIVAAIAAAN
ncbi:D-alanyl-D-alanine carboxypeptidase/D-alanyl-D-alanine-endopeptidase [Granulicella sp. dw_53]|uniref:D-alanyl-D-alanine carboxypeptidase/D-alanyl-D-alanine endopeptidase n=1 Tax=Granulicella sp. dw_53 TaxID=2719792 RepID=UPI001BD31F73|nr:D-alanyl-D-alanine carboxypeptidase/D-alanyl-D-alanine-endopeptidase [Granulicella sp. dw_53]